MNKYFLSTFYNGFTMYAIYFLSQFLKLVKFFSGSARNIDHRNLEISTLEKIFT